MLMWSLVIQVKIRNIDQRKKNKTGNKYEPEVTLEDKVYLETYYSHQPKNVVVDEIP
jgi:hypothetical protein